VTRKSSETPASRATACRHRALFKDGKKHPQGVYPLPRGGVNYWQVIPRRFPRQIRGEYTGGGCRSYNHWCLFNARGRLGGKTIFNQTRPEGFGWEATKKFVRRLGGDHPPSREKVGVEWFKHSLTTGGRDPFSRPFSSRHFYKDWGGPSGKWTWGRYLSFGRGRRPYQIDLLINPS